MIISHHHRFIFIKTHKTASSSMEVALSSVLGPDDIITASRPDLDQHRAQAVGGQNYRLDHPDVPKIKMWRKVLRRPERYYHPTVGYYEHMPSWRVRRYIGEDIWNSYYKFAFERNPWARQVSWYRYKTRNMSSWDKPGFDRFNANPRKAFVVNWDLYTMNREIVLDFVGRYENLTDDFSKVCEHLGLTGEVRLPKVNISRGGATDYRSYYDATSRAKIGDWYRPEIEHFDYVF